MYSKNSMSSEICMWVSLMSSYNFAFSCIQTGLFHDMFPVQQDWINCLVFMLHSFRNPNIQHDCCLLSFNMWPHFYFSGLLLLLLFLLGEKLQLQLCLSVIYMVLNGLSEFDVSRAKNPAICKAEFILLKMHEADWANAKANAKAYIFTLVHILTQIQHPSACRWWL